MKLVLLVVFTVFAVEGAIKGESCKLPGGHGMCKNLRDCPTALEDIKRKKSPPPPTCESVNDETIVCCGTTNMRILTTTARTSKQTTTEYIPKEYEYEDVVQQRSGFGEEKCAPIDPSITSQPTNQKAWNKCLEYQNKYVFPCEKTAALTNDYGRVSRCHHNADELIIGGIDAATNEFPHMVLLGYQIDKKNYDWKCGGSLISEKFVLTAAHCISDKKGNNVSHALVGILRRSDESDKNRYGIKRIIKHDLYHSPTKYHDIALLELDRKVRLDDTTVPACLHTGEPVDNTRASVTGWGTTKDNLIANSDILKKVVLTQFRTGECSEQYYEGMRHMPQGFQEATQICYGDRTKSVDTCSGDSGGPLQVKNKKIVCMYTVIGVTSSGECGVIGVPGLYTRVASYLPWIESIVWPN